MQIKSKSARNSGDITTFRSKLVSNKNLAEHAEKICVPKIIAKSDFDTLSVKEKGTMVEAYVGAIFESSKFKISVKCKREINKILEQLKTTVGDGDFLPPKVRLLMKIQKEFKISIPVIRYLRTTDLLTSDFSRPKFRCSFDASKLDEFKGTPFASIGCLVGDVCFNHRDAEDSVCSMVLSRLESLESEADNSGASATVISKSAVNIGETVSDEDDFLKLDASKNEVADEKADEEADEEAESEEAENTGGLEFSEEDDFKRIVTEVYGAREQERCEVPPVHVERIVVDGWKQSPKKLLHGLFGACGLSGVDFTASIKLTRLSNIISQASFELKTSAQHHCFPNVGVVKGPPLRSKKEAEQVLCGKVLDILMELGEPKVSYFREIKALKVQPETNASEQQMT